MKLKGILILNILIVVVLASCSGSEVTFTPSVLEIPTATNPLINTPIPTGTDIQAIENNPTPEEEKTEEGPSDTVKTFPDSSQYQWQEISSGLIKPLGMTSYYDGDLLIYILEQDGVIRVLENGVLLAEPFLDIKNKTTTSGSEQGLLGIALDPNYADNGIFYLNYSGRGGDTVIARYYANDDRKIADPGSEKIILTYEQPYSNHNGGNLVFGPDDLLYIGLGDGGSGGDPEMRAQNPDTLLGKMLRIAVRDQEVYAIPSDNPFQGGGGRAEIWAMGLRNPWRYSFDRLTGDLWIADVGQGNWEEINFTPATLEPGLNYGWYYREGTHPFKGEPPESVDLIDPIYEYDHSMGCSVTGGYVYRGTELPEWYGVYVFGDFCNGKVWGLLPDDAGNWISSELFSTGVNISSFGEDVFGELYLISHNGTIYKLVKK
jgi:glucose/arabinose dehydrogenase